MFHGGDLHRASKQYGVPLEAWLDLSTGINPAPYPVTAISNQLWHRLPSSTDLAKLESAARRYYGVSDNADIIAAGGSSALIAALPALKPNADCAIILQSYQEHLNAWQHAGAKVHLISEKGAQPLAAKPPSLPTSSNVCILVNPNNPTGRIYSPDMLLSIRDQLGKDGLLIVDEAFMDCSPQHSLCPLAGQKGLVILRSFGKFFGLAGLRLGFAIGHKDDITLLRNKLGSWPISGPAIEIATQAFHDKDWIKKTQHRLHQNRKLLNSFLITKNIEIIGGTNLFTLIRNDNIKQMQASLANYAIWTRIFAYEPDWMRIGIPHNTKDLEKLEKALLQ